MRQRYPILAVIVTALSVLCDAAVASQTADQVGARDQAAAISVTGRAIDSQGKPVDGTKVTLYRIVYPETGTLPKVEIIQERDTARDGAFSFTVVQGGNPYGVDFVVARKVGLALGWAMCRLHPERSCDIVLGQPKDLGGNVVDEKGQPIVDAEVGISFAMMGTGEDSHILTLPTFLNTKTDKNGHFVFSDMPADATFEFRVRKAGRVTLDTFAKAILGDSAPVLDPARIVSGEAKRQFSPRQADIKLVLPLAASVEGMAVEEITGRPVGAVRITAGTDQAEDGFLPPDPVATAADGTFRIGGLAAGSRTVRLATTGGHIQEWVAEPAQVTLRGGETQAGVRLDLTKGGIIEVLVKDAGGTPVAKAAVRVRSSQRVQHSYRGVTDQDGLARIRVAPGQYWVSQPIEPSYVLQVRREQVTIEEGGTKRIEFILSIAPRVTGTIRDAAGNPLAGVRVIVTPVGGMATATNVDGEFALDWNPGLPGVEDATPVLVARDTARNLGEIVEIRAETGRLDLRLKPGVVFAGTVQNQEAEPLAGARVLLMLRPSNKSAPRGLIEQATTSENGTFEIKAIPAGRRYELTAMAKGYGTHRISIDASNLKDNRQDVGQLRLPLADLSISGVVVDSDDKPVAGATVSVIDGSLPPRDDVRTDANGNFLKLTDFCGWFEVWEARWTQQKTAISTIEGLGTTRTSRRLPVCLRSSIFPQNSSLSLRPCKSSSSGTTFTTSVCSCC